MEGVGVVSESYSSPCCHLANVNVFVQVDDVFALWVDLHQHFVLAHQLDDLTDVGTGLLKELQLLTKHSNCKMIEK